jgi:hypothetical protein
MAAILAKWESQRADRAYLLAASHLMKIDATRCGHAGIG